MPWVIKLLNGYVKNGKKDTEDLKEAKKFATEKQAKTFAQTNVSGTHYKVVEVEHESK